MSSGSTQSGCLGFLFKVFGPQPRNGSAGAGAGVGSPGAQAYPYCRKDWLFTKAERSFFGVLEQAIGPANRIFAKIRLCDLLWLPRGTEQRQSHQNRINSKHVDFVICTRDEVRPILVIELDDSSHEREDRKARDEFVDRACAAAGLPMLHVPAKAAYNVNDVRRQIESAMSKMSPTALSSE